MISKKSEPPKKDGNDTTIIFAMSFKHWKTGKIVKSKDGRPFPIRIKVKN